MTDDKQTDRQTTPKLDLVLAKNRWPKIVQGSSGRFTVWRDRVRQRLQAENTTAERGRPSWSPAYRMTWCSPGRAGSVRETPRRLRSPRTLRSRWQRRASAGPAETETTPAALWGSSLRPNRPRRRWVPPPRPTDVPPPPGASPNDGRWTPQAPICPRTTPSTTAATLVVGRPPSRTAADVVVGHSSSWRSSDRDCWTLTTLRSRSIWKSLNIQFMASRLQ